MSKLADTVRLDAEFMQVAELYTGRSDFDAAMFVAELVESESVPFLPALRYAESGLAQARRVGGMLGEAAPPRSHRGGGRCRGHTRAKRSWRSRAR